MRILIVDDEPAVTSALAKWLTVLGHVVDTASDGSEGLAKIRTKPYGLVILDVLLPSMGGIEVARAKLREPSIARTPMVLLSGLDTKDIEAMCESAAPVIVGVTKVLSKPCNLDDLAIIVDAVDAIHKIGTKT